MHIKNITIVGGGSSGWMTAAALSRCIKDVKITLVESPDIPVIGVGESTLAEFNEFLDLLDLKDKDWMPGCSATYKTSIRFTDFYKQNYYYNDILKDITIPPGVKIDDFFVLTKMFPDNIKVTDFTRFFDDTHWMIENNKFTDNKAGLLNWNFKEEKAYHFDAYKFGLVLKDLVAIPNGVVHIRDRVIDCTKNEQGNIEFITTEKNGIIHSDLFVDCTGFQALLINKTLGVPLDNFSEKLPNDRAVVANIPYEDKDIELNSWTNCIALQNGWYWNIPVWDRIGTGYVFSSKFIDDETALLQYKQQLKKLYGDRANNITPKFINFTPGVRERSWHKNVVAVGLSCGFLEPLRSTGLLVTHTAIVKLVSIISRANNNIKNIDKEVYSEYMKDLLYDFRDFVLSQYIFANKNDTEYWKHITENVDFKDNSSSAFEELTNVFNNDTLDRYNTFVRILPGNGYSPLTDVLYNLKNKRGIYDRLFYESLFNKWVDRDAALKEHSKTLPTLLEYLEKNIYNT